MSCYITYNNKNYTEKDFKEYLKSILAEKQTNSKLKEFDAEDPSVNGMHPNNLIVSGSDIVEKVEGALYAEFATNKEAQDYYNRKIVPKQTINGVKEKPISLNNTFKENLNKISVKSLTVAADSYKYHTFTGGDNALSNTDFKTLVEIFKQNTPAYILNYEMLHAGSKYKEANRTGGKFLVDTINRLIYPIQGDTLGTPFENIRDVQNYSFRNLVKAVPRQEEKTSNSILQTVSQLTQSPQSETKTRMGVSYVEEDLKSKTTGAKMLAATNGKTIRINPNVSVEEFFEYFLGNVEGETSAQKKEVLARIADMGYPEATLREMLNTEDKIKDFLVLHEQDHINNGDAKVYFAQGKDLMTPDKIDIEVRATLEALNIIRDGVEVKPPTPKPVVKSEFTHNGVTIPTDFPLGLQQTQALKQIIDYIEDPSKYPFYTLQGYAGTGKTTVIGYVQRYYEKKGGNEIFKYVAPTHAATAQLAVTTSKLGNTSLPATVRATAFMGKDFKGNPKPSLSRKMGVSDYQTGIYIVDEASMLAQKDLDILVAAVKAQDGVVIFMGDNKQIPEVDARNPSKKEMNSAFQTENTLTLDTVYRQSESDLLDTLTEIRDRNFFEPTISINNEDGSLQVLNKKAYATSIVKDFKEDLEGSVYIAYTNAAVTAFNASMKEQLNGEKEPVVGEKIVGYAGNNDKKIEDRDVANSVSYTISEINRVHPEGSRFTINATSSLLQTLVDRGVQISNTAIANYVQLSAQDSFTFNGVTQEHMDNTNKELSVALEPLYKQYVAATALPNTAYKWQHIEEIKENVDKIVGKRNQFGNEYLYDPVSNRIVLKSSVEPSKISPAQRDVFKMGKGIDYGYAITAHKAQGMTVNNAYVDVENISNSGSNTPITIKGEQVNTEKNALYYVAMSRAKNKVVLRDSAVQRSSETQTEQKTVAPTPAPKQPTVFTPEMIRARVKSSFDANGYMDIKETSRGDKVILGAITKYIMATKGIITNNQILEANKTFKLKEEVTIETIKEGVLRIKIKENLLEGDGDVGLFGGLDMSKLTSSGESMANNVLSNIEQAFKCK